MASTDEIVNWKEEIFHMARVALSGRPQDIHTLIRKLARKHKADDTEFAAQLTELLRKSPIQASPARRAEPAGLPIDGDSRLPLVRLAENPVLEIEPVYADDTWSSLRQIVNEQKGLERLRAAGIDPTRTVLFTGLPGVGKTFAAKWIARELGRPLATLDLSAVMSSFLGRTGNNVRVVLDYAKEHECVLLLDELDAVAKRRDDSTEIGELKRLVTVLLQEIDEWPSSGLLLAATNHPDLLDPAVWRRFETVIDFPMPAPEHLAAVCRDLLDEQEVSAWPEVLGIALQGSSFSDAVQSVRRAKRRAALQDGDTEPALIQLVKSIADRLDRAGRQELAVSLVQGVGLSQRQASDMTGVSRDTIRKHERETVGG
jgi:SpoVK/Ycf46/Vps4 family AAA+-type ATPase